LLPDPLGARNIPWCDAIRSSGDCSNWARTWPVRRSRVGQENVDGFESASKVRDPSGAWMRLVIDCLQLCRRDMRVSLGGAQRGVAEQFLDGPEVSPCI